MHHTTTGLICLFAMWMASLPLLGLVCVIRTRLRLFAAFREAYRQSPASMRAWLDGRREDIPRPHLFEE